MRQSDFVIIQLNHLMIPHKKGGVVIAQIKQPLYFASYVQWNHTYAQTWYPMMCSGQLLCGLAFSVEQALVGLEVLHTCVCRCNECVCEWGRVVFYCLLFLMNAFLLILNCSNQVGYETKLNHLCQWGATVSAHSKYLNTILNILMTRVCL